MFNRKNKDEYIKEGNFLVSKKSMFAANAVTAFKTESEFSDFIDDIAKRLPTDLPRKTKEETLDFLRQILQKHFKEIKQIANNPELAQKIQQEFISLQATTKKDDHSLTAFIKSLAMLLAGAHLNTLLPGLSLILSMAAPSAAQVLGIQAHRGTPAGGQDLCAGILLGCLEGYLTPEGQNWTPDMPQFNRHVLKATEKADDASSLQLRNCVDFDKISKLAKSVYTPNATNTGTCSAASNLWHGNQVVSQITSIPLDKCEQYKNQFMADVQSCQTTAGQWKYIGIILGGSLGGLCVLGCCCAASYFAFKKCQDSGCEPKRPTCC